LKTEIRLIKYILDVQLDKRDKECEQLRRKAYKICRKKKRKHMNDALLEMKENFRHEEMHKTYKRIKEIKNGFMARTDLCRDEDGSIISNPDGIQSIWKQYFENLLNMEITKENPEILTLPQQKDDEFKDLPTEEDTAISIQALRKRREPGIPTEIFKFGCEHLVSLLQDLIADV
jgi:hypothetical protein